MIGIGSSAVVHRATDRRFGTPVAVKHFHANASAHDLRQQQQEMAVLARLDHPGLVGLHDGGTEDGRAFVVTDLVEGPTLAERISSGPPLDPAAVRALGAQLADALAHVHAGGIVHRDVKPANVLLGADGRPRLADFGIARALDGAGATATATGCVVGTAAYLAPEQVRGESVGPAADVYALGLVLLEALTGRREYPGLAVESATARLHRPPVVPAGLPGGLGPLLVAMTGSEPRERPPAAVVAATLAAAQAPAPRGGRRARHAAEGGPCIAPIVQRRRAAGRHRRRDRAFAPLATAAFAVTAVLGALAGLASSAAPQTVEAGSVQPVPVADTTAGPNAER